MGLIFCSFNFNHYYIMKKHVYSIMALAGLLLASSCENSELNNIVPEGVENQQQGKLVRKEFSASVDNSASRTALEGETSVLWTKDDKIAVFGDGAAPGIFTTDIQENSRDATFSGEVSESADGSYKAFYPYQEGMTMNAGVLKFSLPSVQTATAGTFATMLNPAYAVTQGNALSFKNICSPVKITLTGNDLAKVSKIVLTASGTDRKLSGDMSFGFNNITIAPEASAVNTVSLEGSFEDGAAYYMIVSPGQLGVGSTFKFLSDNGSVIMTKTLKSEIVLKENFITDLGTFTVEKQTNYSMFEKGEIINIGGIAIQKQGENSVKIGDASVSGIKVEKVAATTTITEGGIYFIEPEVTGLKINVTSGEYLVVIGDDPLEYSKFDFTGGMTLNVEGGSYLLKNIEFNDLCGINKANNVQLMKNAKDIVFDGCSINTKFINDPKLHPSIHFLNIAGNVGSKEEPAYLKFENFIFCNSKLKLVNKTFAFVSLGQNPNQIGKFELRNNVFHTNANNISSASFKLFAVNQFENGGVTEHIIENNIFVNLIPANGYINGKIGSLNMKNNVFVQNNSATGNYIVLRRKDQDAVGYSGLTGTVQNNIGYIPGEVQWILNAGGTTGGNGFAQIEDLTASPFESFNFTDGTYVLKSEYSQYGPQTQD